MQTKAARWHFRPVGVVLFSIFSLCIWNSAQAQVRIIHNPVLFAKQGQPVEVTASVEGEIKASDELRVYYRYGTEESYQYIILESRGNEFSGEIPPSPAGVKRLQYFLSLIHGEQIVTLPESNPFYNPFEVDLTPAAGGEQAPSSAPPASIGKKKPAVKGRVLSPKEYLILSPERGQRLEAEDVVIAVSLFLEPGKVDVQKTKLYLDGRQVRPEVSPNLITYVPPTISEGPHTVSLVFTGTDGKPFAPIRWSFFVGRISAPGLRALPLLAGAEGNIYVESKVERYSGNKLVNNQIGGQFRGKQGFLRFGTKFYVTSLESRRYQPRNRFLFWLDARYFRFYAGDASPRFSELVLWGKRVRGFEGVLDTRFFGLDFVMGQTYRPVEGKVLTGVIQPDSIVGYGTFAQNLYGLRARLGTERGFHLGINLLKVKDDVGSIRYGLRPKDNLVVGLDILLSLWQDRIRWKTSTAFSLLTDDISPGALSKAEIDSIMATDIPIDPAKYEKYIILNTSTVPLDPTKGSSVAYTSTLRLRLLRNDVTLKYKSIGSAYNSLGNTFLRKDIRGIYLNDRIRLLQNRVYLNLGYEDYEDHFAAEDDNPSIRLRTLRVGLNLFPGQGLPNLNLNYKSYRRKNDVTNLEVQGDVTLDRREDNVTNELSVSTSYDFTLFNVRHTLNISYISLDKTDAFKNNRLPTFIPIGLNNKIQSFSLRSRVRPNLRTTVSYANNDNSFLGGWNVFKFNTLDLRADYAVAGNRLNLYAGYRRFNASGGTAATASSLLGNLVIDYTKDQFSTGGRFAITRNHLLLFDLSWINFQDRGGIFQTDPVTGAQTFVQNPSFKDYTVRVRYEWQF